MLGEGRELISDNTTTTLFYYYFPNSAFLDTISASVYTIFASLDMNFITNRTLTLRTAR